MHRFRSLDLAVSVAVYSIAGALLPRMVHGADSRSGLRPPGWIYALASVALLLGQYLGYLGWDLAQRESFATWFVLLALVASAMPATRGRLGWPLAAGALCAAAFFGKPTMGIYLPLVLLAAGAAPADRWARIAATLVGAALATALVLGMTGLWLGAPFHGLRLTLIEAPALYAELFRRSMLETLALPWLVFPLALGGVGTVLGVAALATGAWPRRFVGLALAPLAGILALLVQGKGYSYHAHPVTACAWLCVLVLAYQLHARALALPARGQGKAAILTALLTLFFVAHGRWALGRSPHFFRRDVAWAARAGAPERSEARLAHAEDHDFHPLAMAQAADWLDRHTAPSERVQIYGTDPLVLFWARRLSATPYLYEYDLDVGHALQGAIARRGAEHPKTVAIREMGLRHGADALARLEREPAAAFVLFDGSPFMVLPTALEDLRRAQPALAQFLETRYRPAVTFGSSVHVWERIR
ncbi:hypothetical protein EON77_07285 [bacterium]|nr:MAG: hypothetical protein EON77_07285 [bacterium]